MSNAWLRLYSEFAHDPKVQIMPEHMQRRLVMLMCLRCSNVLETLHETELAFHLRISETELAETKALFLQKGFIDDCWNLLNWEKRQDKASLRLSSEVWRVLRAQVFERDNYTCQYCGQRGVRLECDHVVPVSRGGGHEMDNLAAACFACNRSKHTKLVSEWGGFNG